MGGEGGAQKANERFPDSIELSWKLIDRGSSGQVRFVAKMDNPPSGHCAVKRAEGLRKPLGFPFREGCTRLVCCCFALPSRQCASQDLSCLRMWQPAEELLKVWYRVNLGYHLIDREIDAKPLADGAQPFLPNANASLGSSNVR